MNMAAVPQAAKSPPDDADDDTPPATMPGVGRSPSRHRRDTGEARLPPSPNQNPECRARTASVDTTSNAPATPTLSRTTTLTSRPIRPPTQLPPLRRPPTLTGVTRTPTRMGRPPDDAAAEGERGMAADIIKKITVNERKHVGVSAVSRSLNEQFEAYPIDMVGIRFKDPNVEKEFMERFNVEACRFNWVLLCMGLLGYLFYAGVYAAFYGVYYETYLTAGILVWGSGGLLWMKYIRRDLVKRYFHWLSCAWLMSFSVPAFFGSYYLSAVEAGKSAVPIFKPYVFGTSTLLVFLVAAVIVQSFLLTALTAAYIICLSWLTVTFTTGSNNPIDFIAIPAIYGMIAFACLLTVRDRDFKLRRIFVMERLLALRLNCAEEAVVAMPVSEIIVALQRRKLIDDLDDAGVVQKKTRETAVGHMGAETRWARMVRWVRRHMLATWEDPVLRDRYMAWRMKPFLMFARQSFCLTAVFDLYSAFLNPFNYCDSKNGRAPISPSLCGNNGTLLRNLRLIMIPVVGFAAAVTFLRPVAENWRYAQTVFVIAFAIRGLILEAMYGLIMKWNSKDETHFLILATFQGIFFISAGSSALLMGYFFALVGIMVAGTMVVMTVFKIALLYMFLLMVVTIPMAGAHTVNMEHSDHRFFALWEVLCQDDVGMKQMLEEEKVAAATTVEMGPQGE
ncbi:hypothetical protein HDU96_009892 [Phlyctochytrium bullatum]|nr:hypothetical protein HDU96_009892 [Phlyctochytrium bullatum]